MDELNSLFHNAKVYGKNKIHLIVLNNSSWSLERIISLFKICSPSGVDIIDISQTKLQRILNDRAR